MNTQVPQKSPCLEIRYCTRKIVTWIEMPLRFEVVMKTVVWYMTPSSQVLRETAVYPKMFCARVASEFLVEGY
jgi:hypothetical protein